MEGGEVLICVLAIESRLAFCRNGKIRRAAFNSFHAENAVTMIRAYMNYLILGDTSTTYRLM